MLLAAALRSRVLCSTPPRQAPEEGDPNQGGAYDAVPGEADAGGDAGADGDGADGAGADDGPEVGMGATGGLAAGDEGADPYEGDAAWAERYRHMSDYDVRTPPPPCCH